MNNTSMALLVLAGVAGWFTLTEYQKRQWAQQNQIGPTVQPDPSYWDNFTHWIGYR
ncbi:MAG: hypothetical protein OQL08_01525 [Gammaproteobacteria bacterium]|nr:hypothetical protein [Gammaproteobacteria bacterium]